MKIFKSEFKKSCNAGYLIGTILFIAYLSLLPLVYTQGDKNGYDAGYQAGLNYTPPTMKMIDSLTIPEFTAKERRIISQFMLIIKKASEVKE